MDFLGLQPRRHLRHAQADPAHPGSRGRYRRRRPDRRTHLRAAASGRHDRRVQLEGGAMQALIRSLAPTEFGTSPPSSPCTGPVRWRRTCTPTTRTADGRQEVTHLHPDAEILGDTWVVHLPGRDHADRPARRRATPWPTPTASGRRVGRRCVTHRQGAPGFVEGCGPPYGASWARLWFDIIRPSPTRSAEATATAAASCAYQTAYLRRTTRQYLSALRPASASLDKAAVYLAECRAMGIRSPSPTSTGRCPDFRSVVPEPDGDGANPRRGADRILFGLSRSATSAFGLVGSSSRSGTKRPFEDFYDFCQQVQRRCSTSAPSNR